MKVCIGGTFNILHKGHKFLIDKAFKTAGKNGFVFIGVTAGIMIKKKKNVKSLKERIKSLNEYLTSKGYKKNAEIKPIYDKYGVALEEEYDAIIVSPETLKTAELINKKRISEKKKPLIIKKISYVLAEDKKPISSTRILNKEINEKGQVC